MAKKLVSRKQLTLVWHLDNLKASHVSLKALKEFITRLNEKFGKETPITESYGEKHDYLGMMLDYSFPGEVQITMTDYI